MIIAVLVVVVVVAVAIVAVAVVDVVVGRGVGAVGCCGRRSSTSMTIL